MTAPETKMLAHNGGLPSGNYPEGMLVSYTRTDLIPAMLAEAEQRGREAATNDAADMIGRIAEGYQAGGDGAIACALYLTEGNVQSTAIRSRGPAQEGGE